MKKISNKILTLLAVMMLVTACDWEPIKFDSSKSFVAFTAAKTNMAEMSVVSAIVVKVSALPGSPALTVNFDFDTTGLSNPAVEGVDYTLLNDSKTLSFPNGWGFDTIWIESIDNDLFTGDKSFTVTLTSNTADYQFGSLQEHTVVLSDNEHPLGKWIGTYDVDAKSYGSPGDWDEAWVIVTYPDPADVNNLYLSGFGGPAYSEHTPVLAAVDMENMTITIQGGSEIGTHGAYGGPLAIFLGDEAGGIDNETDPMVGEISEDGSIHIDHVAIKFVGGINAGYVWDSFDTYFTKTSKKGATAEKGYLPAAKHQNLK
ncbi:MAG: Calx-beta domain-containing protein [Bacteroidota bacterium]